MEYILAALGGAFLFFGGMMANRLFAPRKKLEPDDDLQVQYYDSRRLKADKMNMQMYNMLNYTGREQNEEYED